MRFAQEISIFNPYAIDLAVTSLGTRITQTAEEIRLEAQQTLSNYSTTVEMNSAISTKADEITLEVSQTYATQSGVNDQIGGLSSRISQNAQAISSEVSDRARADSDLSSRITQTSESISSEVRARTQADSDLSSRITQNAQDITTKVSAGDIASTINQTAQSVLIQANKIDLSGLVTVSSLQQGTTTINGGCITTGSISGDRISGGTITGTTITGGAILGSLFRAGDATQNSLMMEINGPLGYVYCHNFHLIDTQGSTKGGFEIDTNPNYYNGYSRRIQSGHGIHMLASEGDEWSWFEQGVRFDVTPSYGSDRRLKEDIEPLDRSGSLAFLLSLNPVQFAMRSDKRHLLHHGLIAQEVQETVVDFGAESWDLVSDPGAGMLGLSYTELIADLIAAVQQLHIRLEGVEAWAWQ